MSAGSGAALTPGLAPPVPWTRLQGTALWEAAALAYRQPGWRVFHDFSHPVMLYRQAGAVFDFPYCPDLDAAILLHDVIYDAAPQAERRSADRALRHGCSEKVIELILSTESHAPGADNRLILLDLSNLMDREMRRAGTEAMRQEYAARTGGVEPGGFEAGTIRYLAGLRNRIASGIDCGEGLCAGDRDGFGRILAGISEVISDLQPTEFEP